MNVHGVDLIEAGDMVCNDHTRAPFEPESVRAWCDWLARGGLAVDVGAYTGLYSKLALQRGCIVFAFEPNAYARTRLMANLESGSTLWLSASAVGCVSGSGRLVGAGGLSSANRYEARGSYVQCTTLDESVPLTVCDRVALKIDVEGMDADVLRGGSRFVAHHRPLIIVEAHGAGAETEIRYLLPRYNVTRADGRNLICRPL